MCITAIKIPIDPEEQMTEVKLENQNDYFLHAIQKEVGGWIERVVIGNIKKEPPERYNGIAMYVDEEGMLKGKLPNPRATILYGGPLHGGIIYGDALLVCELVGEEGPELGTLIKPYTLEFFKGYFANEWLIATP